MTEENKTSQMCNSKTIGLANKKYFNKPGVMHILILFLIFLSLINVVSALDPWELKKAHIGVIIDPGHGMDSASDPNSSNKTTKTRYNVGGAVGRRNIQECDFNTNGLWSRPDGGKHWFKNHTNGYMRRNETDIDFVEPEANTFYSLAFKLLLVDAGIFTDYTRDLDITFNELRNSPSLGIGMNNTEVDWRHEAPRYFRTRNDSEPFNLSQSWFGSVVDSRRELANWYQKDSQYNISKDFILISVHTDADAPAATGTTAMISKRTRVWGNNGVPPIGVALMHNKRALGEYLHNSTIGAIRRSNIEPNWVSRHPLANINTVYEGEGGYGGVGLLRSPIVPSALVEVGFATNCARDRRTILNLSRQDSIDTVGQGIFDSVKRYFNASVNSVNLSGNGSDYFPLGQRFLYVRGTGYPRPIPFNTNRIVKIHVTKHLDYNQSDSDVPNWTRLVKFKDVDFFNISAKVNRSGHLINNTGNNVGIVSVFKPPFPGKFDVVVSLYNHTHFHYVDALDNMSLDDEVKSVPGFVVPGVFPVNSSENITKTFFGWNKVSSDLYFKAMHLPKETNVTVYVVKYDPTRNWRGNPINLDQIKIVNITITTDENGSINTTLIWNISNSSDMNVFNNSGRFNIVVDIDKDKHYNKSRDVLDVNEIGVLKTANGLTQLNYNTANGRHATLELKAFLHEWVNSSLEINTTFDALTGVMLRKYWNLRKIPPAATNTFGPKTNSRVQYDANISFFIAVAATVNKTNNVTRYFPYTRQINATAMGLPPSIAGANSFNVNVTAYVVPYNVSDDWSKNKNLDDINVAVKEKIILDKDGGFTQKLIWEPKNDVQKILDSNGTFNLVVDVDLDKHYNVSRDIVDIVASDNKYGFRVGFANTSDENGVFDGTLPYDSPVYVKGVGFPKRNVHLFVVSKGEWAENEDITDPINKVENVEIKADGRLDNTKIWNTPVKDNCNIKYYIIVDVNQDNKFNKEWDVISSFNIIPKGPDEVCAVANAADYGVPQKRKRIFIIGSKKGFKTNEPKKTHCHPDKCDITGLQPYVGVGKVISKFDKPEFFEKEEITKKGTYGPDLKEVPPGKNYIALTARNNYPNPKFVAGKRFWSFLLKLHPELPSWTIAAQPGPWVGPFHWTSRRLRVPEIAAIQTFPEKYIFVGSRRSIQKQIGNAVPPLLAQRMIEFLKDNL